MLHITDYPNEISCERLKLAQSQTLVFIAVFQNPRFPQT